MISARDSHELITLPHKRTATNTRTHTHMYIDTTLDRACTEFTCAQGLRAKRTRQRPGHN